MDDEKFAAMIHTCASKLNLKVHEFQNYVIATPFDLEGHKSVNLATFIKLNLNSNLRERIIIW